VESDMDKGSTFIFTLPLAPADVQAKYLQSKVSETALNKKTPTKPNSEPLINDVRKGITSP